jgi:hypothetical protein
MDITSALHDPARLCKGRLAPSVNRQYLRCRLRSAPSAAASSAISRSIRCMKARKSSFPLRASQGLPGEYLLTTGQWVRQT